MSKPQEGENTDKGRFIQSLPVKGIIGEDTGQLLHNEFGQHRGKPEVKLLCSEAVGRGDMLFECSEEQIA